MALLIKVKINELICVEMFFTKYCPDQSFSIFTVEIIDATGKDWILTLKLWAVSWIYRFKEMDAQTVLNTI